MSTTRREFIGRTAGSMLLGAVAFALDKFMERGGIVLGCSVAFQGCVETISKKDKVAEDVARTKALSLLVPGVIPQPSGVFAVIRAQEAGCAYVRAS